MENQCEQTQNNSIDQLIDQFNGDPIDAKVSKKRERERKRRCQHVEIFSLRKFFNLSIDQHRTIGHEQSHRFNRLERN